MSPSGEVLKSEEEPPSQRDDDLRQASITLVHELSEPLTAIENYVAAAICLDDTDTAAARVKIKEVLEKSETQFVRVNEILRQLRDLLRDEDKTTDT